MKYSKAFNQELQSKDFVMLEESRHRLHPRLSMYERRYLVRLVTSVCDNVDLVVAPIVLPYPTGDAPGHRNDCMRWQQGKLPQITSRISS